MPPPVPKISWLRFWAYLTWLLCSCPILGQCGTAFTLEVERGRFLLGEPVYLRIGSQTATPPALEEGTIILAIRGPEGSEWDYHPPLRFRSNPDNRTPKTKSLIADSINPIPSDRIRFARLIASDGDLVFKNPGRYRLLLKSPNSSGSESNRLILSDSLLIEFRLPKLEPDRRAYGIISRSRGEYAMAVYLEGGQQLRSGMAIINELAEFPSAYRRIARFVVSSDWAQDFTDFNGGASRPMNLEKALEFSEWDLKSGTYVPLRTASLLNNASRILAVRDSTSPLPSKIQRKLAEFKASLNAREVDLLRSF